VFHVKHSSIFGGKPNPFSFWRLGDKVVQGVFLSLSKTLIISMLIFIAFTELRTFKSINTPCSVKA